MYVFPFLTNIHIQCIMNCNVTRIKNISVPTGWISKLWRWFW